MAFYPAATEHPTATALIRGIDSLRYETLSQPSIDAIIGGEVQRVLGSMAEIRTTTDAYFNTIHTRIPILSRKKFDESLSRLFGPFLTTRGDFTALCLATFLLQHRPQLRGGSMQTPLYATMKSIIALLEATNYRSLEMVQCRILVAFYELGHGLNPAVSISVGACAAAARSIGLHRRDTGVGQDNEATNLNEERKRTRWAILTLERCVLTKMTPRSALIVRCVPRRFVSLCSRNAVFATEDPRSSDELPFEDSLWFRDVGRSV